MPWNQLPRQSCTSAWHLARRHGLTYIVFQISGLNKKGPKFKYPGYNVDHPIIPHGVT